MKCTSTYCIPDQCLGQIYQCEDPLFENAEGSIRGRGFFQLRVLTLNVTKHSTTLTEVLIYGYMLIGPDYARHATLHYTLGSKQMCMQTIINGVTMNGHYQICYKCDNNNIVEYIMN